MSYIFKSSDNNFELINNIIYDKNNIEDNVSLSISDIGDNEFQNHDQINDNQYIEDNNDNLIEKEAAPLIVNNKQDNFNESNSKLIDFSFSILNGLNPEEVNQGTKRVDIDINKVRNNIHNYNLEEEDKKDEIKEPNFQKGDYINTPMGDNDIDNNNNQNSNLVDSSNNFNVLDPKGNLNISSNLSSSKASPDSNITPTQSSTPLNNTHINNNIEKITETLSEEEETKNNKDTLKETNKKKRQRNKKKDKIEGIRKKIKSRLHKRLKNYINKKLTDSGSVMIFESLPQNFIADVTIDHNKPYFKYSMRKLLTMIFGNKAKDKEKIDINIKVLNYLDNNLEIKKNSGVELLLNKSYEETIKEYVNGQLFEKDIDKLKIEGENEEYINKYILYGKHWIEYYKNNGKIDKSLF